MDAASPWAIDRGLAGELSAALGWEAGDGVGALAARFPESVPMGSTAKLAAIAAGEVPPGEDPGSLARQLLGRVGGGPSPAWSCWVASTVMAALVHAADLGPVAVAATRRSDGGAPVVDFHAAVSVVVDGDTWLCDPYFGAAIVLPVEPGGQASVAGPLGTAWAERTVDGWHYDLGWEVWDLVLRFRRLGPALDRGDVRAMAAISVTHSGVPLRPYARLHTDGGIADASESAQGTGVLHTWTRADGRVEQVVGSWPEAVEVFAERTGVRVV